MTVRKLLLVKGKIPPYKECPFTNQCEIKRIGDCKHEGIDHKVSFSCATARAFDLKQRDSS